MGVYVLGLLGFKIDLHHDFRQAFTQIYLAVFGQLAQCRYFCGQPFLQ